VDDGPPGERRDFFISYTEADQGWAEWISWQLEGAGYSVLVRAWDMIPGSNWVNVMNRATRFAERTIVVLSRSYLEHSEFGIAEWSAAFRRDPIGLARRLIPVRVEDCAVDGLLAGITHVDLFPFSDERDVRDQLLATVGAAVAGRAKPLVEPPLPARAGVVSAPTGARPPAAPRMDVGAHAAPESAPPAAASGRGPDWTKIGMIGVAIAIAISAAIVIPVLASNNGLSAPSTAPTSAPSPAPVVPTSVVAAPSSGEPVALSAVPHGARSVTVTAEVDRPPSPGRAYWFVLEVHDVSGTHSEWYPQREVDGSVSFPIPLPDDVDLTRPRTGAIYEVASETGADYRSGRPDPKRPDDDFLLAKPCTCEVSEVVDLPFRS
jgi:hypothetical protein